MSREDRIEAAAVPEVAPSEPSFYTAGGRRSPAKAVTDTRGTKPDIARRMSAPSDPMDTATGVFVVGALRANREEAKADVAAAEARLTERIQEARDEGRADIAAVEARLTERIQEVRDEAKVGLAAAEARLSERIREVRDEAKAESAALRADINALREQNIEILARLERLTVIVEGLAEGQRPRVPPRIKALFLLLGSGLALLAQYVLRLWFG